MSAASLAILTAVCWGLAPLLARAGLAQVDPVAGLIVRTLTVTVILVIVGIAGGYFHQIVQAGWRPLSLLAAEGILASLIGHFAYFLALKTGVASRVVPLAATFPLFALLGAVFLLNERLTPVKAAGTLLIVLGVMLVRR